MKALLESKDLLADERVIVAYIKLTGCIDWRYTHKQGCQCMCSKCGVGLIGCSSMCEIIDDPVMGVRGSLADVAFEMRDACVEKGLGDAFITGMLSKELMIVFATVAWEASQKPVEEDPRLKELADKLKAANYSYQSYCKA